MVLAKAAMCQLRYSSTQLQFNADEDGGGNEDDVEGSSEDDVDGGCEVNVEGHDSHDADDDTDC